MRWPISDASWNVIDHTPSNYLSSIPWAALTHDITRIWLSNTTDYSFICMLPYCRRHALSIDTTCVNDRNRRGGKFKLIYCSFKLCLITQAVIKSAPYEHTEFVNGSSLSLVISIAYCLFIAFLQNILVFLFFPVQFSADVDNHYDMKQRSLFIAPLVVIYCRELALHHRPQGATWNKGLHHLK